MRLFIIFLLWIGLAGCSTGELTPEERDNLRALALKPLASDPTNRWADDPSAARLGQAFFFDTRFSGPLVLGDDGSNGATGMAGQAGTVACASCHDPAAGGSDHRSHGATSLGASWTGRNAPAVLDAALSPTPWMFWDGRKDSLWAQALGPVESPIEHNFSRLEVAHLIARVYRAQYEAIFGALPDLGDADRFPARGRPGEPAFDGMAPADQQAVNRVFANFGKAVEAYERRLVDGSSPFDRYLAGEAGALSSSAVRGAKLFVGRAACNECHRGPSLSDGRFHNHAVPQVGVWVPKVDEGRAAGVPKVLADPFNGAGPYADAPRTEHLAGLTARPEAEGAFKTPQLRNVSKTAPYMHTGAFATLWDVVAWYRDAAGTDHFSGQRDPAVQPLRLSDQDLTDLVEFLKALDGDPLPAELLTAPALPPDPAAPPDGGGP